MNNNSKQPHPEYKSDKCEVSGRYFVVGTLWLNCLCQLFYKPYCNMDSTTVQQEDSLLLKICDLLHISLLLLQEFIGTVY